MSNIFNSDSNVQYLTAKTIWSQLPNMNLWANNHQNMVNVVFKSSEGKSGKNSDLTIQSYTIPAETPNLPLLLDKAIELAKTNEVAALIIACAFFTFVICAALSSFLRNCVDTLRISVDIVIRLMNYFRK
ncbi:hypothetical protein HCG51_30080 [Tolypothrix sp. PCC 7910]|uniref:hypothetical protein n=1 Tax=Tolypothrix sp. PCC 7910 TaxID=2099387 RepID=UPI0014277529|nr:hypothetical protein [Tolypothrix sp. PCC 7910]QIR40520.1 hypothetical protein HCG51_30080 [Tolypothrix sp. PCC 7910]